MLHLEKVRCGGRENYHHHAQMMAVAVRIAGDIDKNNKEKEKRCDVNTSMRFDAEVAC